MGTAAVGALEYTRALFTIDSLRAGNEMVEAHNEGRMAEVGMLKERVVISATAGFAFGLAREIIEKEAYRCAE